MTSSHVVSINVHRATSDISLDVGETEITQHSFLAIVDKYIELKKDEIKRIRIMTGQSPL